MALSPQQLQQLFRQGRYVEIVSKLEQAPSGEMQGNQNALVAHALLVTGDTRRALSLIAHENSPRADPKIRARCEMLLGLFYRQNADIAKALGHYGTAVRLAVSAGELALSGWAALHQYRLRAELNRGIELISELQQARKHVTQAADPHLTAYMHDAVALTEVSAGRLTEARRHLKISRSLIDAHPNAWLSQINFIDSAYVDFYSGRYAEALASLERARTLIPIVGTSQSSVINCNYGNALMVVGRFVEAKEHFLEVIRNSAGLPRLGALDGLARIHLAQGRLSECGEILDQADKFRMRDPSLNAVLSSRWTILTKAELLLRARKWDEATRAIASWLDTACRPHDQLLAQQLLCLRAEALCGAGQQQEALNTLIEIGDQCEDHTQNAMFFRAAGVVLRTAASPLAEAMFTRAAQTWEEHDNYWALTQLKHIETPESKTAATIDPVHRIVFALGNIFRDLSSPKSIGLHLLDAVTTAGCSTRVELVGENSGSRFSRSKAGRALLLGSVGGKRWRLCCDTPPNATKALILNELLIIGRAAGELGQAREREDTRAALWPAERLEDDSDALFVGDALKELLATARKIAATQAPILITGETGTGKEVLARTIHALSPRAQNQFLPFNCASTPQEMLDSQLFGHRRGAFTGATEHFKGVIRTAAGGTLFLDEIGDMPLQLQPKMLRFLESGEVHPVGEAQPVRVDVRVIAATNAPLDTLIAQRRFREDLFYRLDVVRLHLPPLRERRVEIPTLAAHYLAKYAAEYERGTLRIAEETMEYLALYRWPGNVRQLANEMRRLATLAEPGAIMMPEHLSPDISASRRTIPASERALDQREIVVRLDQPMAAGVSHLERAMIQYALQQCGGRVEDAAARLGLSRKGLYLKRQRFGIDPPPGRLNIA